MVEAERLNRDLVSQLKASGCLRSSRVEAAFLAVPRHLFLPNLDLEQVYRDEAIPTKQQDGMPVSSSSQPAIMAEMLEQLDVRRGQNVLEVGTGTGYNAALLSRLVGPRGTVVSLDLDADIVAGARRHLRAAGCECVNVLAADGGYGHAATSPYDRIIVTAGAADIPPAWREQLKPGGRLVVPLVLQGGVQASVGFVGRRDCLESDSLVACGFMPLRGAFTDVPHGLRLTDTSNLIGEAASRLDRDQVLGWMQQPQPALRLGVELDEREIWDRFRPWLALRDEAHAVLVSAEAVGGGRRFTNQSALVTESGLALLDLEAESPSVQPFGPGGEAAERMLRQARSWEAAGRPGLERVRVRSYPLTHSPALREDEAVLRRPNTTLVLSTPKMR